MRTETKSIFQPKPEPLSACKHLCLMQMRCNDCLLLSHSNLYCCFKGSEFKSWWIYIEIIECRKLFTSLHSQKLHLEPYEALLSCGIKFWEGRCCSLHSEGSQISMFPIFGQYDTLQFKIMKTHNISILNCTVWEAHMPLILRHC